MKHNGFAAVDGDGAEQAVAEKLLCYSRNYSL